VVRLMWVRHPISRLLSGWRFLTPGGGTPQLFASFVMREYQRLYDAGCDAASMLLSLDPARQHYLPPQHCRCGLPCGVRWRILQLEACPIQRVFRRHLGNQSILPPTDKSKANAQTPYNATAFLAPLLGFLNRLTAREQRALGYCELGIRDGKVVPACEQPTPQPSCDVRGVT